MSHFWAGLFAHLRGCGRDATLFMFALAGIFGLLLLCAIVCETELRDSIVPALPWVAPLPVAWACLAIYRARARRRDKLRRSPLSDDELRVARLKLRKPRG